MARPRDVALYLVSIPVLIAFWVFWLIVILLVGVNSLSGARIVVVACAVVLATRGLAHVHLEHAHELAKNIPLTLVTLVLISGALRNPDSLVSVIDQMQATSISTQVTLLLVVGDVALTGAWYWIGVRRLAPRGWNVPGIPA
jgi:hypothetical protein